MIQDIQPHVFRNHFAPRPAKDTDFVLCYQGRDVLLLDGHLPTFAEMQRPASIHYLFSIDEDAYFLATLDAVTLPVNAEWHGVHPVAMRMPGPIALAAATGNHINHWHLNHRFCGRCGGRMYPDTVEQALRCESCGCVIYPDIHPAVNVAITNGDKLLMVRHAKNPKYPFALVAGFVEFGESAEQTVVREVMEEVGLKVKDIVHFSSQPWGMAGNLQIGYFVRVDGDPTPKPDESEIFEARWFEREDIPEDITTQSITGTMIHAFKYRTFDPYR